MKTNNIQPNNNNISFGVAFKVRPTLSGTKVADVLDAKQEFAMYENLTNKLKQDKFIRTELGLKSDNMTIEKDTFIPTSNALRVKDETGDYFISDISSYSIPIGDAYRKMRKSFDKLFNK